MKPTTEEVYAAFKRAGLTAKVLAATHTQSTVLELTPEEWAQLRKLIIVGSLYEKQHDLDMEARNG